MHRPLAVTAPSPLTVSTTNPNGTTFTIPPELSKSCSSPPCNVTVTIGNTTYLPGQTIPLPVGTTPLVYTIVDSTGATSTSPTTVTMAGPPSITAPADQTLNATSPAGVSSYTIPQPANTTCPQPVCQVSVLYNGTLYKPGDTIPLPVGNNTLTYTIVDSKGNTAQDVANVVVVGPPSIDAPAPLTLNATSQSGAPVTLQPQADQYCGVPNCTIQVRTLALVCNNLCSQNADCSRVFCLIA